MRRLDSGYSLLELLIALTLLGFIAIAITSGIRFGSRAWDASDRQVTAVERMQGAQMLLRTLLQRAVPRDVDPTFAVDLDLFRGTSAGVTFTADAPSSFGAEGATRFELRVEGDAGARQLVLFWQGANVATPPRRQTLLAGAEDVTLAYGALDQNGAMRWTNAWSDQSGAPALVMIRAAFPKSSKARWPTLIARTRIMRDPACVFDAASYGCRRA